MDQRPYRYRIEHRDGERASLILRLVLTAPPARQALRFEALRLMRRRETGIVVLIDLAASPSALRGNGGDGDAADR